MRVLHVVTNSDLGGAPRVVTELSAMVVRDGHACAVAANPDGPMWAHLDNRIQRYPLPGMRRSVDPAKDFRTMLHLRRIYREFGPDIIHLHSSKAGVLGRFAALSAGRRMARRCIYTIHGFDSILKIHRKYLPLERFLSRLCGAVVPVSWYDERNLRTAGIGGNIIAVHNGASDRLGRLSADENAAGCLEASKAAGRPVVLSIARLEAPKRPDLFVEVAHRFPQADFFWVGNVNPPGTMLPATLEVPGNVRFLGESPEAGFLINGCDIFLLLSDYEGLPMSILEAMSCAKPIVASRVGGIVEALNGGIGFLVSNELLSIEASMNELLGSSEARQRFGQASRARYEATYSAEKMWEGYLRLYGDILKENHAKKP